MNKKFFLIPLIVVMFLLAAGPAAAQSAPVTATISAVPAAGEELTVGDPIALTLSVNHPADYQVILPQLEPNWGDFVVASQSAPVTTANGDGSETTSQVIDVRLFAPGAFETPPIAVTVADGAGQIQEVPVDPINVTVTSVLIEGDTALRDIKPQAELPYANLLPWIAGGLLAAVLATVVLLIVRRRRARRGLAAVDNRLPHEVALDELRRIKGLGLPEQGRFKEHYTLVSECMRLYVEKTTSLPMLERTTVEIQASLKHSALPAQVAGRFLALLDISDLVKFSKFTPDAADAYALVEQARAFVEATRPAIIDEQPAANGHKVGLPNATSIRSTLQPNPNVPVNGAVQKTEASA